MMKTFAFFILLCATPLVFGEVVKVHVPGMVCQLCLHGMQAQFKDVVKDKEKDVIVDMDKKMVTIKSIKPISDEDIKKRVVDAGYNVKKITREEKKPSTKAPVKK